jgi:hypothetical protein
VRPLALLLAVVSVPVAAVADDKITVATGAWSESVDGLRGRLVLAQGRTLGAGVRETLAYVELENVGVASGRPTEVHFDPGALRFEMTDAAGKAVPQTSIPTSGGRPGKAWVSLPFDSSVRLRANPFGFGRADGLLVHLNTATWTVPAGGEARLSAVLTVTPPDDRPGAWKGELRLPAARIAPPAR